MELMMTLMVVAIIAAIATPSFREFRLNARMTGASNDLLTLLQQARSEAIKRQRTVGLCASTDPFAAQPACGDADDPVVGWVVWADDDGTAATLATDGNAQIDPGEEIIARTAIDPSLRVRTDGTFVSYQSNGFTRPAIAGETAARAIVICDDRGDRTIGSNYHKRLVSLSNTGRASIVRSVAGIAAIASELGLDDELDCAQGGGS